MGGQAGILEQVLVVTKILHSAFLVILMRVHHLEMDQVEEEVRILLMNQLEEQVLAVIKKPHSLMETTSLDGNKDTVFCSPCNRNESASFETNETFIGTDVNGQNLEHLNVSPIVDRDSLRVGCGTSSTRHVKDRVEKLHEEEYPGMSREEQYHHLFREIDAHNPIDKDCLFYSVGETIAKTVNDHWKSPNKIVHLLSSFAAVMTKDDAERLIGKKISNNRWRDANRHKDLFGQGILNQTKKVINHRRRVEEKTLHDFIEWLNASNLLQNLAFGEKIVKYTDGFRVSIEKVQRMQSISSIIRLYYSSCLDADGQDDGRDESNIAGEEDEDSISDESTNNEASNDGESREGKFYITVFFTHTFPFYSN